MNSKLKQIAEFLDRYKSFQTRHLDEKISHYKSDFENLLTGYKKRNINLKTRERKEATRFNIFDILNIRAAETTTHTPFLKNLLDPAGTHGQGNLFLETFLKTFIPLDKTANFELQNDDDYNLIEEKATRGGRIDIYIESLDISNRFGIIIENKIYAGDQPKQLERYYDYLIETLKFKPYQMMMFYLTVDGSSPSQYSLDVELRNSLMAEGILKSISYKKDITKWLNHSSKDIEAFKVKELIRQYLKTIQHL